MASFASLAALSERFFLSSASLGQALLALPCFAVSALLLCFATFQGQGPRPGPGTGTRVVHLEKHPLHLSCDVERQVSFSPAPPMSFAQLSQKHQFSIGETEETETRGICKKHGRLQDTHAFYLIVGSRVLHESPIKSPPLPVVMAKLAGGGAWSQACARPWHLWARS